MSQKRKKSECDLRVKAPIIRVDNRESAILTAELTYLGYQVENLFLDIGDFESDYIIGEIKRENDFYRSIADQRIYYQPERMVKTGKQCYWILAGNPNEERRHLRLVLDAILNLALWPNITLIPVPSNEAAIAYAIHILMRRKNKPPKE
jgi:ERCC4-type nuclease